MVLLPFLARYRDQNGGRRSIWPPAWVGSRPPPNEPTSIPSADSGFLSCRGYAEKAVADHAGRRPAKRFCGSWSKTSNFLLPVLRLLSYWRVKRRGAKRAGGSGGPADAERRIEPEENWSDILPTPSSSSTWPARQRAWPRRTFRHRAVPVPAVAERPVVCDSWAATRPAGRCRKTNRRRNCARVWPAH